MIEVHTVLAEQGVRRALAYVAGLAEADISPSTSLVGLGIESVGMAALRLVLEAELGIRISVEDVARMILAERVGDVFSIAEQLLLRSEVPTTHVV